MLLFRFWQQESRCFLLTLHSFEFPRLCSHQREYFLSIFSAIAKVIHWNYNGRHAYQWKCYRSLCMDTVIPEKLLVFPINVSWCVVWMEFYIEQLYRGTAKWFWSHQQRLIHHTTHFEPIMQQQQAGNSRHRTYNQNKTKTKKKDDSVKGWVGCVRSFVKKSVYEWCVSGVIMRLSDGMSPHSQNVCVRSMSKAVRYRSVLFPHRKQFLWSLVTFLSHSHGRPLDSNCSIHHWTDDGYFRLAMRSIF